MMTLAISRDAISDEMTLIALAQAEAELLIGSRIINGIRTKGIFRRKQEIPYDNCVY